MSEGGVGGQREGFIVRKERNIGMYSVMKREITSFGVGLTT
jgi:hypothetical protein